MGEPEKDQAADEQDGARGGCLCGQVRFRLTGPLDQAVSACHCGQCRRTHGHAGLYARARRADVVFETARGLAWYRSSADVRRGFCRNCGASLFWETLTGEWRSIAAGILDAPSGVRLASHIFVADKGDYYEIDDNLPQFERS